MRCDDTFCCSFALGQRQRQPVRNIRPDRENKSIFFVAGEESHRNLILAAELSRAQSVDAIDNAHRRAMHNDRRKLLLRLSKHPRVFRILPRHAW